MILREGNPGCHRMFDLIAPDYWSTGGILIGAGTGGGDRTLSQLGGDVPRDGQIAATDLRQFVRVRRWKGDYG